MKKRNVISQYQTEYEGQTVTVNVVKNKEKKGQSYGRSNASVCPNCLSRLEIGEAGLPVCSKDKLQFWEKEFIRYETLKEEDKLAYMQHISMENEFLDLYDRWKYAQTDENDTFDCGYTNKIFMPIPTCNVTIPDPIKVSHVEKKLGRPLTEEELFGESELWEFGGQILKEYRKGARKVKIQLIRFPEDC